MTNATPAGWYPDPQGPPGSQRYWDGSIWTEHIAQAPPVGAATVYGAGAAPVSIPMAGGQPLADYGRRLGGWIIDWVIVVVVSIPFVALFGGFDHGNDVYTTNGTVTGRHWYANVNGWGILVNVVIVLGYGALFCGSNRGQTPGMMVTGVRVVDNETGGPIGHARALLRAFVEYVLAVVCFVPWVVDMLFPLWDGRRQTIHDKSARSVVVVKTSSIPVARPPQPGDPWSQ